MVITKKNRLLTTCQVAEILHIHVNTVRRWNEGGMLKSFRIGPRGDRRFMESDVMNLRNSPTFGYKL